MEGGEEGIEEGRKGKDAAESLASSPIPLGSRPRVKAVRQTAPTDCAK